MLFPRLVCLSSFRAGVSRTISFNGIYQKRRRRVRIYIKKKKKRNRPALIFPQKDFVQSSVLGVNARFVYRVALMNPENSLKDLTKLPPGILLGRCDCPWWTWSSLTMAASTTTSGHCRQLFDLL